MLFQLTILGSGSASPVKNRFPTSQFLQVQNKGYLFDCGEGAQMRMIDFGVSHSKIDTIFITHLHGDHFFGLFGLITSMSLNQRTKKLTIVGSEELEHIVKTVIQFDNYDLSFEINFLTTTATNYQEVYKDKLVTVCSYPLKHRIATTGFVLRENQRPLRIKKEALAEYKIPVKFIKGISEGDDYQLPSGEVIHNSLIVTNRPKSRSFAFCTDTSYREDFVEYIRSVDICYHEATFLESEKARAIETNHSTAKDAADIALKADVQKLLIGHLSARYPNEEKHIVEARNTFANTFFAVEGSVHEIPFE